MRKALVDKLILVLRKNRGSLRFEDSQKIGIWDFNPFYSIIRKIYLHRFCRSLQGQDALCPYLVLWLTVSEIEQLPETTKSVSIFSFTMTTPVTGPV